MLQQQQQQENSRKPFLRYQKPPSARFAIMCFAFLSFTAMALGSFGRYIGVCFWEVLDSPCHCVLLFSRVATTQLLQQDCFRVVKGSNNTWCASLSLWNLFFCMKFIQFGFFFLGIQRPRSAFFGAILGCVGVFYTVMGWVLIKQGLLMYDWLYKYKWNFCFLQTPDMMFTGTWDPSAIIQLRSWLFQEAGHVLP